MHEQRASRCRLRVVDLDIPKPKWPKFDFFKLNPYTALVVLVERGNVEGQEGSMLPCGNEGAVTRVWSARLGQS